MEKVRAHLGLVFSEHLSRLDNRRWILHDIYKSPGILDQNFYNVLTKSIKARQKGVFLDSSHGDHWHVIHDCQYNGSWCRCTSINIIRNAKSAISETSNLSEDSDDSQLSAYSRNLKKSKKESQRVLKNPFSQTKQSSGSNLSLFKEHLRKRQMEAFPEEFEDEEEEQTLEEKKLFGNKKKKKTVSFADLVEGDIFHATTQPITEGISSIIYVKTSAGQLKYGSEVYPGCTVVKFQVRII